MNHAGAFSADSVAGIGGGSVLDTAKLVAAQLYNMQGTAEVQDIGHLKQRSTDLACIPTTSGAGSEMSPNAIFLNDTGDKIGVISHVRSAVDMDVLVIATDARSKSPEAAKALIKEITGCLLALGPEIIFKKTDSLLRGHVGEELLVQMGTSGKLKALLVPANPALDRTIRNGVYYAGHVPLNESSLTSASRDKIATSGVLDLPGEPFKAFSYVISLHESLPQKGIMIGNTFSEQDLVHWAGKIDADTLPAGNGGFFNAILESRLKPDRQQPRMILQ